MHDPMKERLEDYLRGSLGEVALREFEAHLESCAGCRAETSRMRAHAMLLRELRAPAGIEPAPGFYGRVMGAIEAQARPSIWSVFLDPVFGKRLMYATMAVLLLLSGYLVGTQPGAADYAEAVTTPETILVERQPSVGADQQRDRDVILVNLATYRE